jgi:hypothetical protein
MKATKLLCVALLAVLALGLAHAESALQLVGTWTYAGNKEEKRARVSAIEAATKELNMFKRGTARGRLIASTEPAPRIDIPFGGKELRLDRGGESVRLPLDKSPIRVKGDDGEAVLRARRDGEKVVVVSKTGRAERTITYAREGAKLVLSVKLKLVALSKPVHYKLTYTPAEQQDEAN